MSKAIEIFRIYKQDRDIGMDANTNSKDLTKEDVKKIDDLIELWKKVTIRSV